MEPQGTSSKAGPYGPWSRWSGWIALLWAACFLYLGVSASPPRLRVLGFERLDLMGHAGAAALLAALVGEWLLVGRGWARRRGLGWALAAAAGLGVFIEGAQVTSSVRSFEVLDVLADVVGAGAGMWLYALAAARVPRRTLTPVVLGAGLLAASAAAALAVATASVTMLVT